MHALCMPLFFINYSKTKNHLLTDSHADEHLRAIVAILNFSAQERKCVYAKVAEKKGSGYSKRQ